MTLVLLIAVSSLVLLLVLGVLYRIFFVDTSRPLPEPDDLIVVAEPRNEGIANLIRDQLQDAGIPAMARDVDPAASYASTGGDRWEVRVRYADLARAREVLGDK